MIRLQNELLTVEFKTLGGALSSIRDKDGVEYLWQGDARYWGGQAPVLFPICGSVREDRTFYRPEEVSGQIPRHGLVRKQEFQLVEQTEDCVSFVIKDTAEMYDNYPYHFRLEIRYSLNGSTIRTQYIVENKENAKEMPYAIGGHPGFNCPLLVGETYEDYYLEFEKEETCSVPRPFPETGLLDLQDRRPFLKQQKELDLNYDLFEVDAVTLDQLQSRSVSLCSRKHAKGLKCHFHDFSNLIIWSTPNKGPFIALEPWSSLSTSLEESDYLADKKGIRLLPAGQQEELYFDIEILV